MNGIARIAVALAAFVVGLLGRSGAARADCAQANAFEEARSAARVAVVRAAQAAGPAMRVTLVMERVLKGPAEPPTVTVAFNPMLGVSMTPGHRYVVFLTPDGRIQNACGTIALASPEDRPIVDALQVVLGAPDDRARTAALVAISVRPPFDAGKGVAQAHAIHHLAARPDLLAQVSAPERAQLVSAVGQVQDERAYGLAWALARLRAAESVPAWIAFLGASHPSANHRPIQDALELLANRRDPAYTPGHDFHGEQAAKLREGWVRWHAAHGAKPAQDLVAAGSRERGAAVPILADRASLARIVATEKDELVRRVALAACEQLLRSPGSLVGAGGGWFDAAAAVKACPAP